MKYLLYKHKPGKIRWYVFSATNAWRGYKDYSNQRKPLTTNHTSNSSDDVFFSATSAQKSFEAQWNQKVHDDCLLLVDTVKGQFVYY